MANGLKKELGTQDINDESVIELLKNYIIRSRKCLKILEKMN